MKKDQQKKDEQLSQTNVSGCRKIIFLDMDGVLATPKSLDESGFWGITKECQDNFGYLLARTDAEIVVSSSWRLHTVEDTKKDFTEKGFLFSDKIVGVTIRAYHYIEKGFPMSIPRGVEIKQWIDQNIHRDNGTGAYNRKKIGEDFRYVILDDDSDMLLEQSKYFIRTNGETGFTHEDMQMASAILNGSH
jgi:hypothetical protein